MSLNKNDDESDDSLPDPSQFFTFIQPPKTISPGDIVWAKYKELYWPALVRTVYSKQKKTSIWYCDKPGVTFKIPSKNICSFFDAEMTAKILKDVKKAGCVKEHEGLTRHAREFIQRKANGMKDDPIKYFDQTYPYFIAEQILKKNPNVDVTQLKISPIYIPPKEEKTNKPVKNMGKESLDSEGCTDDDDDEVEAAGNLEPDYLKNNLKVRNNTNTNSNTHQIVEFILSGKADFYLKDVLSKIVPSDYRDIYEEAISRGKVKLSNITYAGPVENSDALGEIISYLLKLREKTMADEICLEDRNMRDGISKYLKRDTKGQFVYSVWLPESIIFAISKIEKISLLRARLLFKDYPESLHHC